MNFRRIRTITLFNFLEKITKKRATFSSNSFRGIVRIRTGVDGFADRCLAARPRRRNWIANIDIKISIFKSQIPNISKDSF